MERAALDIFGNPLRPGDVVAIHRRGLRRATVLDILPSRLRVRVEGARVATITTPTSVAKRGAF